MVKLLKIIFLTLIIQSCSLNEKEPGTSDWSLSILPSSIRLDPSSNQIIDHRFHTPDPIQSTGQNLLHKNWIYDGHQVLLHAARGEYISFQLVLNNNSGKILKAIMVDMPPFKKEDLRFTINPEFFLEWAVEVKTPSTGYSKASADG